MTALMPTAIVLIVCKTMSAGPADPSAKFTGHENLKWATEHSMMICRRHEVQMYDQAEAQGATSQQFSQVRCQRAGIVLGVNWDRSHRGSKYRFWRVACPVPIVDTRTGEVLAYKMPECPRINKQDRVAVHCEVDTSI